MILEWGVTARETSWKPIDYGPELGDIPGWQGHAFVRDVAAGVKYVQPPDIEGLHTWIRRSANDSESFVMPFAGEAPPASETVLGLHQRLAEKRRVLKDGDPDLDKLDHCIDGFLARVAELHERRVPVGFLQPRSVLFCSDSVGTQSVQLPDLGFVFDVNARVMGRPSWLGDSANVMFDSTARERNKAYLAWAEAPDDETFQPLAAEDVRIAARLIAFALAGEQEIRKWCGAASPLAEVPPPAAGQNDTACQAVWDVLHRAIRGELHSISELRELLTADARPSRHFLVKPPRQPTPWERLLRSLLWIMPFTISAVAAVLVGGAGFWAFKIYGWRYTKVCPHVSSWDKPLFSSLEKLESLADSAAASEEGKKQFLESLQAYVKLLRATPGHSCDESCTERLLAKAEPWIDGAVNLVVQSLREQPRPTSEELADLNESTVRIEELNSLRRETSSPLFQAALARLDRQLSLRGAKPAARAAGVEEIPGR